MAEQSMTTAGGTFTLLRPHTVSASPLRAWSAADELLLDELHAKELGRTLIVNDEFGALTVGLAHVAPVSWGDSALSRDAIAANLAANDRDRQLPEQVVGGHEQPTGLFDTVLIRVPKTVALLDHQLHLIRHVCRPDTLVIGCGMARHIHRSTSESFERHLGPTTTSRATKKARLIFCEPTAQPSEVDTKTPQVFVTSDGVKVAEAPGTFSAGQVDVGSALLLQSLQQMTLDPRRVADLGCGNGVLSATTALQWRNAHFSLFDVSDLAIAAARTTWELNGLDPNRASFHTADGYDDTGDHSFDLVITNPPFHQGHALDRDMTDRLLSDTARVLSREGMAAVVVQRHLQLHSKLKRWFGAVEVLSKHPTHVVLHASSPKPSL